MTSFSAAVVPVFVVSEAMSLARALSKRGEPDRREAALRSLARRAVAVAALTGAVNATRRVRVASVLVAAAVHRALPSLSWSFALFVALRTVARAASRGGRRAHLHPASIFAMHLAHNHMMVHAAECVAPGYVEAWLSMVSGWKTHADYVRDFGSQASSRSHYAVAATSSARLHRLPAAFAATARRQLPFVAGAYLIPMLLFWRSTAKRARAAAGLAGLAATTAVAVARSAVVLAALPVVLLEFPVLYAAATGQLDRRVRRNKALHVAVASVLSTGVFLLEPRGRLETMVVYTAYRVVEAAARRWAFRRRLDDRTRDEAPDEAAAAALCVGVAAAFS
uniref:Uncharacterized protein n=1 Tax=Bicosoecida sp. CB-2014 TaxID=1486930 RepID=A0A7S1GDQ7_9STRA|mmetsp:Transcript_6130/g.21776  ORF Transcript_6130/g.21776 Transcript_6130/m.21776 type:complete len:337 (+) Transcript_6130:242-1252(+)